ncbi:uridylate-specific endoribonuclease A-like [Garra rufa]|uniref:uridylate-specific endoribonuclease A-like n=1 Tax=Garra rufa TaxID=137080 RepID=UPI003CCEE4CE
MKVTVVLFLTITLISQGYSDSPDTLLASVTDEEIKALSETLYKLDHNRATASDLVLDTQTLISSSQTGSEVDHSSRPLFKQVSSTLLAKPTYQALLNLLDNYNRMTGTAEYVPSLEEQEQDTFLQLTMNTDVGNELYNFLNSKGAYSSQSEFIQDLKMMWFGLYSRANGQQDSSGFEHIFSGEIKNGKVSGFHNWLQFYLKEKDGVLNYYSHSFNGPWSTYPDVLGMQFEWDGYFKEVGSAFIGCSPEFDLAMYSLCYITRPGKRCYLSLGGQSMSIQTYTWDNSSYGDGKKYIGSAYPATP